MNLDMREVLRGAIDTHVHAAPDRIPRLLDSFAVAEQARDAGMRAIVLKDHYTLTADRAWLVQRQVPGIDVFGGLVLNRSVGGFNPHAVEAAIKLNAKIIWGPTSSAASDLRSKKRPYHDGLQIFADGLDHPGAILPEVKEVLKLVASADIVFATGHLHSSEVMALLPVAREVGVKRVLVTHPEHPAVGMDLNVRVEAAREGAYLEHCFNFCTPHQALIKPEKFAESIRAVGPARVVMATDMGQVDNFTPAEGLRVFAATMERFALSQSDLRLMMCDNPARLLYE